MQLICGYFQPRKLLETAKCDVEDTQALAVSNADNDTSTPIKAGVKCDDNT